MSLKLSYYLFGLNEDTVIYGSMNIGTELDLDDLSCFQRIHPAQLIL
jgi:hypothetical protein